MKKLFMLAFFSVIIIFSGRYAYAAEDIKPLKDIGIFESGIYKEKSVTVGELCRITSKLVSKEEIAPIDNDKYAGYVSFMKASGVISDNGDVSAVADGETVCKMYLFAIGYNPIAEINKNSYTAFASKIGITNGTNITADGGVTYEMLGRLTMNTITKKLPRVSFSDNGTYNINVSGSRETILTSVYEIGVYEAIINSIDINSLNVNAEITRNIYASGNMHIEENTDVVFRTALSVNILDGAPAVIWVCDGEILSAYLKNNVEVRFGVISSINSDENENSSYSPAVIKKLMVYDDKKEYVTDSSFKVRHNGETAEKYMPISATGKYARIILVDNKVTFFEIWDFKAGGLIKSIEENTINYIDSNGFEARFNKIDEYSSVIVIVNGIYTDIGSLKPDSVFSWRVYDSCLVIAANEQVISAQFTEITDDSLRIGDIYYLKADCIYCSKDGVKFSNDSDDLQFCLKNDMSAYFNIENEICYIAPVKDSAIANSSFIGVVTGYTRDDFIKENKLEIINLENTYERNVYIVKKKAVWEDGITLYDIEEAVNKNDGGAIYEFQLNSNGEITKIKMAFAFSGIGSSAISFSRFDTDDVYPSLTTTGNVVLYIGNTPISVIYRDYYGNYCVKPDKWSNLYGRSASGIKINVYGYNDSADPRLIVLTGKTENLCNFETRYGVITKKTVEVNAYNDRCCKITVLTNQDEKEYIVPYEEGKDLPETAYITFLSSFRYDSSRTIKISSYIDLTGDFNNWEMTGFTDATVMLKGSRSFTTSDGITRFLHPYYCYIAVLKNGRITKGDMFDISAGDRIYYYCTAGDVRIIFVEKNELTF